MRARGAFDGSRVLTFIISAGPDWAGAAREGGRGGREGRRGWAEGLLVFRDVARRGMLALPRVVIAVRA